MNDPLSWNTDIGVINFATPEDAKRAEQLMRRIQEFHTQRPEGGAFNAMAWGDRIADEQLDELVARTEKARTVLLRIDQFRDLVRQAKSGSAGSGRTIYMQPVRTLVGDAAVRVRFVSRDNIKEHPTEANPSPIRVLLVGELPNAEATAQSSSGMNCDGVKK